MLLHSLCKGPQLEIFYDSVNDWLYAEWEGVLSLPVVQQGCLELARCFQQHAYPRVLNNNTQVTDSEWDVPSWLGRYLLGHMASIGITHLAWVCSPALRGRAMAQEAASWVSEPVVALFDDVADAVAWLQHTQSEPAAKADGLPRPSGPDPTLKKMVGKLDKLVSLVPQPAATGADAM